ncbi:MAG TPA: porin family protein [Caulobacteraceae bacterium]|nr:porin family protein [Caulobacteraceae bacterium]
MKSHLIAATCVAALAAAAPAFAQDPWAVNGYGTLGYTDYNAHSANVGAITGRLGARFGQYFGVEGELSGGVSNDHINYYGTRTNVHVNDQFAGYGVAFLPVLPNADLFARVGYGQTQLHLSNANGSGTGNENSWNIGAGGQYFFDGKDGVRLDYTRFNAEHSDFNSNVWSVAYVRKF